MTKSSLSRLAVCFSLYTGAISANVVGATVVSASDADNYIIRHSVSASVPVSAAVEVPVSASMVYLSGKLPPIQDHDQPLDSPLAYGGDTQNQTVAVLREIEKTLVNIGLELGDVVKMQVFLVGDPALDNKMDLEGFANGYAQFFGTKAQPHLPARTTLQVASLANRGMRVEIDITAVRKNPSVIVSEKLETTPSDCR
ncbi:MULTISPECIES: RidA family protein [unclassified Shewanella]|uniref:RidA family protein n=1 Tax=unclassified Shewanella TaxID=196818 RepID=UPI0021DABB0C|nr:MULTISPECIES: RidA family protein [unclassified Shewanella]MCU8076890.1 RidA family protein [Shewanella sp. SM29]MCU8083845.1 RidA family protein [Shewanella sp. SM23]